MTCEDESNADPECARRVPYKITAEDIASDQEFTNYDSKSEHFLARLREIYVCHGWPQRALETDGEAL